MSTRKDIYYWKCDRASSFYAINGEDNNCESLKNELKPLVKNVLKCGEVTLGTGGGQGNHLTFIASTQKEKYFIRIENGPEKDDYMEVETCIINKVHDLGIPTVKVYAVDSQRATFDFAWQIMEKVEYPDLNKIYKSQKLQTGKIMYELGSYIAKWQRISAVNYGPFDSNTLRNTGYLEGLHAKYSDYYMLNLDKHINFLVEHEFITQKKANNFRDVIEKHKKLLNLDQGCLVHKDLALWNILGTEDAIKAVIDWDDAIIGDPTDDISLMACFHSKDEVKALINGYQKIKPLPENFLLRFWLHLLRNMLFKSVIRVGAGYFKKDNKHYLVQSDKNGGQVLQKFTLRRLDLAYEGLIGTKTIDDLL